MSDKHVYVFGGGSADGSASMRDLLGGKGANLAEMARLGLPVPPGFTITTDVCAHYSRSGGEFPAVLASEVDQAVSRVEQMMGRSFGDPSNPLLVSVRSGARMSMPGMMDTVLNLGLNDRTAEGLADSSGDRRFAFDAYRRFVAMYSDVVLQVRPRNKTEPDPFESLLDEIKHEQRAALDTELTADALEQLVRRSKALVRERTGKEFPDDPLEQLWGAISAVFRSWDNPRAAAYRRLYHIPAEWGTAVNVQAMVYGNLGEDCATGVAFTRDPATGDNSLFGEFLVNAQGEDVVAGTRTPQPISRVQEADADRAGGSLEELMPACYEQLQDIAHQLEKHYRDMQDLEFTIEKGKLFILQTRSGKRTGLAAVRIATEMVDEQLIDEKTAITRVEAQAMEHLLAPVFSDRALQEAERDGRLMTTGLPAGPGAATGRIVFHAEDAKQWAARGESVILARVETSPEDVGGMEVARGILTARGGITSHAALVARQRGKPCVVGCSALRIDYESATLAVGSRVLREGDWISLDGARGQVFDGRMTPHPSEVVQVLTERSRSVDESPVARSYMRILEWADRFRRLGVRANVDTPQQAAEAVALGAEGIGLCRTEHMFFENERITAMRRMILAADEAGRREALAELLPMQREDFAGIFRAMRGRPVTIRTLDPPLHEFLPHEQGELAELSERLARPASEIEAKVEGLRELNPMLGHRGCRLGLAFPEITAMQARAILEAACDVAQEQIEVHPEIMIPLVGHPEELKRQRAVVEQVAEQVFEERGRRVSFQVGTMIELPRAALVADQIAASADFFSFGTNDLTQTTFGISRDDAASFLPHYIESGIFATDPFQSLDQDGVGQLLRIGCERGRTSKTELKIGICGEHGGDPQSVRFSHEVGLDYVSCSPRRLPVARVAAAQAAIASG
ncbi:MAG: pyruvate, phosphate dikinase [Acidobacteriota bacterium]|nr:MAG: pyruvate, phosphate dikinase [Acidobacteriota bacterium]